MAFGTTLYFYKHLIVASLSEHLKIFLSSWNCEIVIYFNIWAEEELMGSLNSNLRIETFELVKITVDPLKSV